MTAQDDGWIQFKCLEVTQPIGTFYVGVMKSSDLVKVAYADVRRIEGERREVETYLGIERPLSRKRVAELKEYVSTLDAAFPSSVIVAVKSVDEQGRANVRYDRGRGLLELRDREDI